ncbi:hypothetical protein QJS10_CPA01g01513 [Acorus calamus]|uniref:Protein SAR DEFICIENT 1 n=1 Tax=Acorus calamus TaxID=4465 RepID=A0AAV9FHA8_ACOCL|nr:hypothetical protein QJS10_CPA01g01513 [Acorus calamus]
MAAKRLLNGYGSEDDQNHSKEKRIRRLPSFATVIREAVRAKTLQNFCSSLEPLIRRVVREEVEHGLIEGARSIQSSKSPQLQIQAPQSSTLELIFSKKLSLPIFTGSKIEDEENNPLRVLLIDTNMGRTIASLPSPIKIKIVVIDGDFPSDDCKDWTKSEFDSSLVRERAGKRPLLAGEVLLTLRDGVVAIRDLAFTDNSSWIRSRNFRIGARVAPGSFGGERIKEALTEAFVVKDHRGELYKKHYPPALNDKVWRLEKIGKDGAFHRKLSEEGINTVQDFLKLWVVDPASLRRILGGGMSDKMWEGTLKHARTCLMGNKLYLYRGSPCTVYMNPICQVVGANLNGMSYNVNELNESQKAYVEQQVLEAYKNWNSVEEIDGLSSTGLAPPICEPIPLSRPLIGLEDVPPVYHAEAYFQVESLPNDVHTHFIGWNQNTMHTTSTHHVCSTSNSSSDEENIRSYG